MSLSDDFSPAAQQAILAHPATRAKLLQRIELDIMQLEQIRSKNYLILHEYPELSIFFNELPKRLADLRKLHASCSSAKP